DINHNRIAGDEKGQYGDCTDRENEFYFPDQEYYVVAKVQSSFQKEKVRGPYNGNDCFCIGGTVDTFKFGNWNCSTLYDCQ
ncbi:8194_t:CDS:1, partial [Racocetra fulgida]